MTTLAQIYGGVSTDYNKYQEIKDNCKATWEEITNEIGANLPEGTFLRGEGFGGFYPLSQFFKLDALNEKEWPNNIADNSIFIGFKVNLGEKSVEIFRTGHIWLTPEDRKKSYLCMCTMKKAVQAGGGEWFRKSTFKDSADLAKKVLKFWRESMAIISNVTGGYPYKQMTINIY